jgi:hypothetical protein
MTDQRAPYEAYLLPEAARAAAVAGLRQRFGVPVWWGSHTRRFWALVPDGERGRLIEAANPHALAEAIAEAFTWARHA